MCCLLIPVRRHCSHLLTCLGSSSDDSGFEQWRRSIVISDVPKEIIDNLLLTLELKKRGGGSIDSKTYHAESRKLLVTFHDAKGNC